MSENIKKEIELSEKPKDYLLYAILATLLCCMPLGMVAIYYSSKMRSAYALCDDEMALIYSRKARNWCIWSLVPLLALCVLYIILHATGFFENLS